MYEIRFSNGPVDSGYDTIDDAVAALRADYPDLDYGHDGDLEDHGERTLCWASPEDSEDDDGSSAVASIYRSGRCTACGAAWEPDQDGHCRHCGAEG